jgi:ribose transport system permease protein
MSRPQRRIALGLDRFSAIYLWMAFVVVFSVWSPHLFLTASTFQSIASTQAVAGIVAIAVLIPLACGEFDLSVGANAGLTGIVVLLLQVDQHWPVLPAILASILVGVFIGWVNGLLVVRFGISSFIATLGTSSVLSAVVIIVTNSQQPLPVIDPAWTNLTQTKVFGVQVVVAYLIGLALVVWWLLARTPVGRYLYATGGNAEAARLSGVRVERWRWVALVASGTISGMAGVLFSSVTGPSLTFGPTLLLPAFAAAFLGSTQLQPGRFNVWGTLIAIYVLATGVEGLQLVSGQEWLADMFNGVALVAAVGLAVNRRDRSGRRDRARPDDPADIRELVPLDADRAIDALPLAEEDA